MAKKATKSDDELEMDSLNEAVFNVPLSQGELTTLGFIFTHMISSMNTSLAVKLFNDKLSMLIFDKPLPSQMEHVELVKRGETFMQKLSRDMSK